MPNWWGVKILCIRPLGRECRVQRAASLTKVSPITTGRAPPSFFLIGKRRERRRTSLASVLRLPDAMSLRRRLRWFVKSGAVRIGSSRDSVHPLKPGAVPRRARFRMTWLIRADENRRGGVCRGGVGTLSEMGGGCNERRESMTCGVTGWIPD